MPSIETQSRDTAENAHRVTPMVQRDGVQRIARVMHELLGLAASRRR